jgi:hypothetical protein
VSDNQDSGPPTAVMSIKDPTYPVKFTLKPENQMIPGGTPQPLDGRYKLYARHSPKGLPMAQEGFLGTTLGRDGRGVLAGSKVRLVIETPLPAGP